MSHVLNVLHPGTKKGNDKEMLTPLRTGFASARAGLTYAHILSYTELTLASAHHSFASARPPDPYTGPLA